MDNGFTFVQGEPTRRAAIACQKCKARKVRCNVVVTGRPCTNCLHDKTDCKVPSRKKHTPRRKRRVSNSDQPLRATGVDTASTSIVAHTQSDLNTSSPFQHELNLSPNALPKMQLTHSGGSLDNRVQTRYENPDEGENTAAYAMALNAQSSFDSDKAFYAGDQQGVFHFVLHVCRGRAPVQIPQIHGPPQTKMWDLNEVAYLRSKGVFDLPPSNVCESFIQSYFRHVHPFMPILDAGQFLSQYSQNGSSAINLLLLWSVFLAASNFVDLTVLQAAGYASRKALKRAMYSRAKALYDSDHEDDKVCLVQSSTLMAFWYSDAEERAGPTHWLGIAIGLCQLMGFHRATRFSPATTFAKQRQALFRRIWWSCYMRDRWLSLGLGRPMRIHMEDCDIEMPTPEDVTADCASLDDHIRARYMPCGMESHAQVWVKLIELSRTLGSVLNSVYKYPIRETSAECVQMHEREIEKCRLPDIDAAVDQDDVALNKFQFQLLLETVIIVLHRPQIKHGPDTAAVGLSRESEALRKTRGAATRMSIIVEKLIEIDVVHKLRPMNITALIAAMQIHLMDSTGSRPLAQKVATSKLDLCMMVLSELRETYWGANFTYKLFEAARAMLNDTPERIPENSYSEFGASTSNIPNGSREISSTSESTGLLASNGAPNFNDSDSAMSTNDDFWNIFNIENLYNDTMNPSSQSLWSLNGFQNMFDSSLQPGF